MSIDITHRIEADEGPLRVADHGPWTDIQLSPGQYLTLRTVEDCDRLMAAATEAKRLRMGGQDLPAAETSPANPYGGTIPPSQEDVPSRYSGQPAGREDDPR